MTVTINGTTGIAGVDGSAGTPAIQGADTNTGMFFPAADTIAFATAGTEDMRIDPSGRVLVGLTSANTSGANFQVSQGVTFPATQSASSDVNTLDDYEEGTWTPAIKFAGNNVGMTFSQQLGQYIKIGRQVTVWYAIQLTAKGSSVGNATVTGVPFTSSNYGHGVLDLNSGMSAVPATGGYGIIAGSDIFLRYNSTTGYADFSNSVFTNTSLIIGVVTYYVVS
jgi:hypothetical protein